MASAGLHTNPSRPNPWMAIALGVWRGFIYGSIFISLCSVALCIETSLLLGTPLNSFAFYLVVFCATLGQYNIHYFIKRKANPDSTRFMWSLTHHRVHLALNVAGAIGLIAGLTRLESKHLMVLAIIAAVTVLYSFPFLTFPRKKRLKDFGLLKISLLSYVWTLITVWFPVVTLGKVTPSFMLVFASRFVFMFALCLAFDIRDKPTDAREGIHTLPVMLGVRACYQIIRMGLVVFVILSIFLFRMTGHFMQLNGLIVSAMATYFMVEYSRTRPGDMVYLAGIDGMMLLQGLLVMVAAIP